LAHTPANSGKWFTIAGVNAMGIPAKTLSII
jgi:hypothetical protein